jgi:uroporphyrinogen decarboxylase
VEQGVSLGRLSAQLGEDFAVQGNLDPEMLVAGEKEFRPAVEDVLNDAPKNRHIFNLGHGILPAVSPERVTELVGLIRKHDGV